MTTNEFILVLATNLATLALSFAYFATRLNEVRVEHVERIQQINQETMAIRRVQEQITVEDILGRTEEM